LLVNLLANCHCTGMCQNVSDLSEEFIVGHPYCH
jgi:hypothetical protein